MKIKPTGATRIRLSLISKNPPWPGSMVPESFMLARRLSTLFLRDANGRRPVYGGNETFQKDPHWRDLILFYEYFHGDNGAGLGASHQTGWTGTVALGMDFFGRVDAKSLLETDRERTQSRIMREQVAGDQKAAAALEHAATK